MMGYFYWKISEHREPSSAALGERLYRKRPMIISIHDRLWFVNQKINKMQRK